MADEGRQTDPGIEIKPVYDAGDLVFTRGHELMDWFLG